MFGCPKPIFRSRSVSVSTLAPDTSLPVPAVVGHRTSPIRGGSGVRDPSRVFGDRATLVGGDARGLRDVERGSAADADDGVEAAVTHERGELVGEGERRLARPLDDALEPDARALGGRERGDHGGVRRNGLFDDDERTRRPERSERAGKLGDDAVAEGDLDRKLRVERRDGRAHGAILTHRTVARAVSRSGRPR